MVYEDAHLIVIDKPAGHGGASGDLASGGHAGQRALAPLRRLARRRRWRAAAGHRASARQGHLGRDGGGQGRADAGGAAGAISRARSRAQVPGARRGRGRRARLVQDEIRARSPRSQEVLVGGAERQARGDALARRRAAAGRDLRRGLAGDGPDASDPRALQRPRPSARRRSHLRAAAARAEAARRRQGARAAGAARARARHHPSRDRRAHALVDAAAGGHAGGARDACAPTDRESDIDVRLSTGARSSRG